MQKTATISNSEVTVQKSTNELINFEPSLPTSKKYNPDVMVEFEKIKNTSVKYEFTKEMWKGITGEIMDFAPDVSENFICARDERNFEAVKSEIEKETLERERERLEIEEQNRIIKEQAIESVMKFEDEICTDDVNENIVVFDDLKINSGQQIGELSDAQKDYNALLFEISKL